MAVKCGFISAHLPRNAPEESGTFGEPTPNIPLHLVVDFNP
jgi:hypothetical protein